jgi:threonine aldolase
MSALGGVYPHPVPNQKDGTLRLEDIRNAIQPDDQHRTITRLVCIENTQNVCGGIPLSVEYTNRIGRLAQENGLKFHIDGARIFNAALALGTTVAALAEAADSVGFCLSKGLGAPVGSVLCGDAEFIARARKNRKMLGGGMRQAGVIAAAGVYALECMVDRLAEDHENAKLLARGLAELPIVEVDPDAIETNIVIFRVDDAAGFARSLKREGVLCTSPRPGSLRMVTHYGITRSDIEEALEHARTAAGAPV